MSIFTRFLNDQSGATAIEYGLIAALVSVAAIAAMTTLGTKLTSTFEAVSNQLNDGASLLSRTGGAARPPPFY